MRKECVDQKGLIPQGPLQNYLMTLVRAPTLTLETPRNDVVFRRAVKNSSTSHNCSSNMQLNEQLGDGGRYFGRFWYFLILGLAFGWSCDEGGTARVNLICTTDSFPAPSPPSPKCLSSGRKRQKSQRFSCARTVRSHPATPPHM